MGDLQAKTYMHALYKLSVVTTKEYKKLTYRDTGVFNCTSLYEHHYNNTVAI